VAASQSVQGRFMTTQVRYQKLADARRSVPLDIKVGNLVFILAKHIRTTCPSKKLSEQYLGPFEVTGKPGSHSFQIRLPEHLWSIYPVFHISQLKPCPTSLIPNRTNPPLPLIIVNSEIEFEIAQILDSKLDQRRTHSLLYYVQWAGYEGTVDKHSWLSALELENATELVCEFHTCYPNKPRPLPPPSNQSVK